MDTNTLPNLPLGVQGAIDKFKEAASFKIFHLQRDDGYDHQLAVQTIMHHLRSGTTRFNSCGQEDISYVKGLTGFDHSVSIRVLMFRHELMMLKRKGLDMPTAIDQLTKRISTLNPSLPTPSLEVKIQPEKCEQLPNSVYDESIVGTGLKRLREDDEVGRPKKVMRKASTIVGLGETQMELLKEEKPKEEIVAPNEVIKKKRRRSDEDEESLSEEHGNILDDDRPWKQQRISSPSLPGIISWDFPAGSSFVFVPPGQSSIDPLPEKPATINMQFGFQTQNQPSYINLPSTNPPINIMGINNCHMNQNMFPKPALIQQPQEGILCLPPIQSTILNRDYVHHQPLQFTSPQELDNSDFGEFLEAGDDLTQPILMDNNSVNCLRLSQQ